MNSYCMRFLAAALAALLTFGLVSPLQAETCEVRVVFTKGGFIVGVGGGHGVLTCRGQHRRFVVSGMSVGFTIGASTARLTGRALNVLSPFDIQGSYAAVGAGGALAAGVGSVQLKNERGVILQLSGGRVGVELSAAVGGVTITLE
ncbi:hypothetical protein [Bradyrhizobium genosp. P]|uniref:hypothetical protein n=1 Tax=Bradyrhizobium genosp. P TaxID=83641 RepID=UPI003CF1B5AA